MSPLAPSDGIYRCLRGKSKENKEEEEKEEEEAAAKEDKEIEGH